MAITYKFSWASLGIVILILLRCQPIYAYLTSNARNDPFPVYNTLLPHEFLYTWQRNCMKGLVTFEDQCEHKQRFSISASPFGQNAKSTRNFKNETIPLGDIDGRWNMLALLFGPIPTGKTLAPTLVTAFNALFPNLIPGMIDCDTAARLVDPQQNFGFFTNRLSYRKRGIRFDVQARLFGDFGLSIETGVTDICYTLTQRVNLICGTTTSCPFVCSETEFPEICGTDGADNLNQFLMNQLCCIANEIGLDIDSFNEVSVEDVRFNLFWRRAYLINSSRPEWPDFLIMPYFEFGGSIPTGKEKQPNQIFGLPFGSNDHASVGFSFGLDFEWVGSIGIGAEAGITHFFSKDFTNYFVPTSKFQQAIFPFRTSVEINPGRNWYFAANMTAYHFVDRLSFYFQYVILHHDHDQINLTGGGNCCDQGFLPEILEDRSNWKVQLANIDFNYDISPHISLGFLWQAPLARRRAFKSTTIMFSFNATF